MYKYLAVLLAALGSGALSPAWAGHGCRGRWVGRGCCGWGGAVVSYGCYGSGCYGGVPVRYGSSMQPILIVAPLASSGPTQ